MVALLDSGSSSFDTSRGQNAAESRPISVFNTDLKNVLRPISTLFSLGTRISSIHTKMFHE